MWLEEMAKVRGFLMGNVNFSDVIAQVQHQREITNTHFNIGKKEISIHDLAQLVQQTIGLEGELKINTEQPDGIFKLTNPSKLNQLGWENNIDIQIGVNKLYNWYIRE